MTTMSISSGEIFRWMRIALVAVCILALAIVRVTDAFAADINVAGLIVDYGDGRIAYAWVPFEEEEISGIELLERSGIDYVSVGFGGMGEAVCQIDITGCPVDDCRKRMCQTSDPDSPFWRYSRQVAPGDWAFAATGASAAKVRDGDIEAWSWTGTDVDLPAITMDELATLAGADSTSAGDTNMAAEAAFRTVGGDTSGAPGDSESFIEEIVGAIVVLGIAGFAIVRSRRAVRAHP